MARIIYNALIVLGFVLLFGSVGAMENDNISVTQCIIQSVIAFGMCVPKVLHEIYKKYHNTI